VRRALSFLVLVACTRRDAPIPSPVDAAPEASVVVVDASIPEAAAPDASADDAFLTAAPKAARSIGHTSIVFKIELANGKKCAFKPASRKGGKRYRGEIAAYRLAVALGLSNVPPAMPRAFRDAELRPVAPIDPYAEQVVVDEKGLVHGALIPWIDKLEFAPLESDTKWKGWLKHDAEIPEDQRTIAADVSTMIAFDFVTGNWDRWSGGNIGLDRVHNRLLFIDNDGAFFEVVPKDALARSRRLLSECDRFSKSFVEKLRAIDPAESIADLVTPKALAGVKERRDELLRILDQKELYFP
jgi:hypothetical protein